MAVTVYRRGNSFAAQVSVKPYPIVSKSFKIPGRDRHTAAERKAVEAVALAWAEGKEKELEKLKLDQVSPESVALTLAKLIDKYLAAPETKQLKSWHDNEQRLDWWIGNYGTETIFAFYRARNMRAGRDKLFAKLGTPATTNRYLRALSSCWSWGMVANLVPEDLVWPKKLMLKEPPARDRYLSDDERAALLKAAEADPVMTAMIITGLGTGMRQENLLTLKWGQVDFAHARVSLAKTKNGRAHAVHLPASAVAALQTLKASTKVVGLSNLVFTGSKGEQLAQHVVIRRFKNLCKSAILPVTGPDKVTFHILRHSTASYLAQAGASLLEIGSVLGHRSPNATARYAHLVSGAKVTGSDALDRRLGGTPTTAASA
jgi:integrase